MVWMVALSLLGVLFAFPMKRRFINDEQYPFPEGRACGVVLDALHEHGNAKDSMFSIRTLTISAMVAALVELLQSKNILTFLKMPFLAIPTYWDELVYKYVTPTIMGTPFKDLTIRMESSIVMVAAGGLMGIKTGFSLLVGAVINYWVLAPWMIKEGIIVGAGFKHITMWSLWGGVAMMTTASLFSFFSKPQVFISAFRSMAKKSTVNNDVLKDIEIPSWIFALGIPLLGSIIVVLGSWFFDISPLMGIIAIPLVFIFTLIAAHATALTAITPQGALGKLTQLTFSALSPGNITTNIMTAGITGEVASNSCNLLMDIKPGYMLGGKPRHQAIGHVLGIFAGAAIAIPVFYMIFNGNLSVFLTEQMPMPSAQVWQAVAEVLTKGLSFLHPTAQWAIVIGAILGIVLELLEKVTHQRFPLSAVGIGLAFVLPFSNAFSLSLGAILFWLCSLKLDGQESFAHRLLVKNRDSLCAGAVAGGALIGIVIILCNTLLG
jgi:uncharacterized oligopeptide transporter (OPT) family protein